MGPDSAYDLPSIDELRRALIPSPGGARWDLGELPRAVLHLDDQTTLGSCDVLLRLAVVVHRALDGTRAARAVALREVICELLPKGFDHPFCFVLRALAGLEQGTAGRRREQREEVAGRALGPAGCPIHVRSVRRRVREDGWPWLLDRLIEREVQARKESGTERADALPTAPSRRLMLKPAMIAPWISRRGTELVLQADIANARAAPENGFESVLDIAQRMAWLGTASIGDDGLASLDTALESVVARYENEGPASLAPEALALRRYVQELLQCHQHPRQRRRTYGLAGRLSALLGYMAVNRGNPLLAEAYCAEAFALATEAEDPDLQAWVRGTESFSAYYQHRYGDALALARDGQQHARGGSQTVRLAINGEARALGRLGDHRGVDEAVDRAYTAASELPAQKGLTPCISFEPYSEPRVAANAATAYLALGATEKVLYYARQIESLVEASDSDWSRSLVHLDIATALVRQRQPDPEHAAVVGIGALRESSGNPIESVRQRAGELATDMRRWAAMPAIRDFTEALRVWNGNVSTMGSDTPEAT